MEIPEDAWTNNPILRPWPHDPDWKSHEDAGINHDHYRYGVPKDVIKVKELKWSSWILRPAPLPGEYYRNHRPRNAAMVRFTDRPIGKQKDESIKPGFY